MMNIFGKKQEDSTEFPPHSTPIYRFWQYVQKSFLAPYDRNMIFCIVIPESGRIYTGYFSKRDDDFVKIKDKAYEVKKTYLFNRIPTAFLSEKLLRSIDFQEFVDCIDKEKSIFYNPQELANKLYNNDIKEIVSAVSDNDLKTYAIYAAGVGGLISAAMAFGFIKIPGIEKVITIVTDIATRIK